MARLRIRFTLARLSQPLMRTLSEQGFQFIPLLRDICGCGCVHACVCVHVYVLVYVDIHAFVDSGPPYLLR